MKKYLSLFLCLIAVIALVITGCGGTHGYGSDAAGDNPPLYSQTLIADSDGAITETPIGASGLRLKAEAGTLESGAKIIITVSDSTEGSGNEYLTASAKVYDIKAILESSTGSAAITSSEKSVLVTVPNDIPGATEYFLATRASSGSSWSFARINDTNSESNPVNASARMVRAAFGSEFYIALHNLNQQFALFAHKDSSVTPKKAIITAVDCEAPSTLKEKDGKYVEDLKVNVVLSANNATQLKNSDVILKYNYQSRNSKDAAIKASGASLKNTSDAQAKAGSGNKYAHSFELSSFDNFAVNGEKINIEFTLNMTGVTTEEFAENYYIEVLAANDTNFEFLPSCFCNMTLKTVSSDIKFIEASLLQPEDGSVTVPVDQKDVVVQFPDEINWTADCEALVKVTSTNANETGAQYVYKYSSAECLLFVERQSNFAPNAEYKVEISEGIMGVAENTMVEPVTFTFTTTDKSEPSITELTVVSTDPSADATDVAVDKSIVITFNTPIIVDDNISRCVLFGDAATLVDYNYQLDSTATILTLTPKSQLANNHEYGVSIANSLAAVDKDLKLKENYTFSFTTVANTVSALISSKSCTGEGTSALYYPKAVFAITFSQGLELADADIKAAIKLDGNALDSNDTVVYDKSAKLATITFETPFAGNSEHTLSFEGMTAGDGSVIEKAEALSFKVMPNITASLTTPATATGVATNTSIVVELSAAVGETAYSADNITIKDSDDNIVALSSTKTVSEAVYTVTPASPLKWIATYTVTVATATIETTGQKVEGKEFTFCTKIPDVLVLQDPNQPNSESNPYLVYTSDAFEQLKDNLGGYFKQMADIDLGSYDNDNWNPIGNSTNPFTGIYDGNTFKIKNLMMNIEIVQYNGLFGYNTGTIKNIRLIDISASFSGGYSGTIVGYNKGNVSRCYVNGTIRGGDNNGGLVGQNEGTIEECCFEGRLGYYNMRVGGIVGMCQWGSIIKNCYSNATVDNCTRSGGIAGDFDGQMINCYSISSISDSWDSYNGTLVGIFPMNAIVENCFSNLSSPDFFGEANPGVFPEANGYSNSGYNTAFGWDDTVWNNLTSGGSPTLKWMDDLN